MGKIKYKKIFYTILGKVLPSLSPTINSPERYISVLKDKKGIEIGGPSAVFGDFDVLPVYRYVAALDNCNFSGSTVWEGTLNEGLTFQYYPGRVGKQFIREASDLYGIADGSYDFLLSSHCLEHCANAIKALTEWKRVVKKGGYLLIIVPHKAYTFDHDRPITSLAHFIEDYNNKIGEDDLTHLDEILSLHDLSMDKRAGTKEQFLNRSRKNIENRCLHHHTFDHHNLAELVEHVGLSIVEQDFHKPYHTIVLAKKI